MMRKARPHQTGSLRATNSKASLNAIAFPFMKLPHEVRDRIYRLAINYDSVQEVALMLENLEGLEKPIDACTNRTYAQGYWDKKKRSKVQRYQMRTPALLLVNRAVYSEVLPVLRNGPFVFTTTLRHALRKFDLTIAHLVPFRALKKIQHVHFVGKKKLARFVTRILWSGSALTKDINFGVKRMKAVFPGMLKAAIEDEIDLKALKNAKKKNPRRHADSYPEGVYDLRKVSFESVCEKPMLLDLTEAMVRKRLCALLKSDSLNEKALRGVLQKFGKPCGSYAVATDPRYVYEPYTRESVEELEAKSKSYGDVNLQNLALELADWEDLYASDSDE